MKQGLIWKILRKNSAISINKSDTVYVDYDKSPKKDDNGKFLRRDVEKGKFNQQKLYYDVNIDAFNRPISVPDFEKCMPRDDKYMLQKRLNPPSRDFSEDPISAPTNKIIPMNKELKHPKTLPRNPQTSQNSITFKCRLNKLKNFLESSFR